MTAYVDNSGISTREGGTGHSTSRLLADSTDELLDAMSAIGVDSSALTFPGTTNEHAALTATQRTAAVEHGAVEIRSSEAYAMMSRRIRALAS